LAIYILLFPEPAINAASFGLVLWYKQLLPSLLPFAILSYIFVETGILDSFTKMLHRLIKWFYPISSAGIYPLLAGFLFGFPLGSRILSQLVKNNKMDYEEGNRLFAICNHMSPVFVSSFILNTSLKRPDLILPTYAVLYLPPLVYYRITTKRPAEKDMDSRTKNTASGSQINFKIIDAGIMSGFETMTKLGGYIILFAIIAQLTTVLPIANPLIRYFIIGITEITNGITTIAAARIPFEWKYGMIVFCTAFGGWSGFAQTSSMTKEVGFSMGYYLKTKLLLSTISAALAAGLLTLI
jgi:sporulation integral membrane protein YlbJ